MKVTVFSTAAFALLGSVVASPLKKRAMSDADILNYALTLEHLENKFYGEGIANFTEAQFAAAGYDSTFYANLKEISFDEYTHVSFLTSALKAAGATPVAECTYAFGVTSVASFIATAAVLEGVGVTAYLGAAASISNKQYLAAAGSILTVESRHSAYLRSALKESPYPQSFDVPLDFNEVYSLAAPFITGCPSSNPALSLTAFPGLMVTSTGTVLSGNNITVAAKIPTSTNPVYAAFITVTGPVWAPISLWGNGQYMVTVPQGVHGQSYLVLTKNNTAATDDTVIAGPAIVPISGTDGVPGSA